MTKAPTDWMPLNVGAYLSDTMDLSAEQHGAYLMLIMHYWKNRGPLKNDLKTLTNVTKISRRNTLHLLERFFSFSGGKWQHSRIDEELSKALENKNKRQKQTQAATASRMGKTYNVTSNVTTHTLNLNHNHNPLESSSSLGEKCFVEAFDRAGGEVFGSQVWGGHRPFPSASDSMHNERLCRVEGATPEKFQAYCQSKFAELQARGRNMPRSPGYFVDGFAEYLAGVSRPVASAMIETPEQESARKAIEARMDAIRQGGQHVSG